MMTVRSSVEGHKGNERAVHGVRSPKPGFSMTPDIPQPWRLGKNWKKSARPHEEGAKEGVLVS